MVKNSDKEKFVYSGCGITSDSAASWSFGNDTARNAIIFGADNTSSSNVNNRKKKFLIRFRSNLWNKWKLWFTKEKNCYQFYESKY